MIGWSGAISAMVRAIARAVSGSFDGVLMTASERTTAFRMMLRAEISGLFPATMWTVRAPIARIDTERPSDIAALDPSLEIGDPDRLIGDLPDHLGVEQARELLEGGPHQRRGHVGPVLGAVERLLQVLVAVEHQAGPELGEEVDDLVEAELVDVAQGARVPERQPVQEARRIGGLEAAAAPALE